MKEFLFYQNHKQELKKTENRHLKCSHTRQISSMSVSTNASALSTEEAHNIKMLGNKPSTNYLTVFSEDTLKETFDRQANQYQDQFISAGFPPKICSELVDNLCSGNKYMCQVLDVGCGNGFVGQYLSELGFQRLQGIDCRETRLLAAAEKKCYDSLERMCFGLEDTVVPEKYLGEYDFVTCASLVNNSDLSIKVFTDLLSTVKVGGYVIFSSKLDKFNNNEYEGFMSKLTQEGHWKFTTNHSFYRYDKLFGDLGKFSNKLVKVFVYQKKDHNIWICEQQRLEQERQAQEARQNAIVKPPTKLELKEAARLARLTSRMKLASQKSGISK